ncbi:MAG: hypothetical protein ACK4TP_11640 [Hyphomicrobium sp.]|jgi:hypothetical protein
MVIKTALVTAGLLVTSTNIHLAIATFVALGASATAGVARNSSAIEPGVAPAISAGTLKLKDSSIDYGSRVRVRIYRPDGIYELRNGNYELSPSGFGEADTETQGE